MEQIVLSSSSTLKFEPATSAAPFARFDLPNWIRALALVVACGTAFAAPGTRPLSESGLRPYDAPTSVFAPAEERSPATEGSATLRLPFSCRLALFLAAVPVLGLGVYIPKPLHDLLTLAAAAVSR